MTIFCICLVLLFYQAFFCKDIVVCKVPCVIKVNEKHHAKAQWKPIQLILQEQVLWNACNCGGQCHVCLFPSLNLIYCCELCMMISKTFFPFFCFIF